MVETGYDGADADGDVEGASSGSSLRRKTRRWKSSAREARGESVRRDSMR
jgi:hypothetical protein